MDPQRFPYRERWKSSGLHHLMKSLWWKENNLGIFWFISPPKVQTRHANPCLEASADNMLRRRREGRRFHLWWTIISVAVWGGYSDPLTLRSIVLSCSKVSPHLGELQKGLGAAACCSAAGSLRGVDVLTEGHVGGSRAGTASLEPVGWRGSACPAVSFAFLCFHHPLPLGQKAFILVRPIVP